MGRKVLAIGNPFGLDTTLTTGIVSALGREIQAVGQPQDPRRHPDRRRDQSRQFRRPLLNSLGQLVGVNTAIYSPSGASAGIGFAIPVNTVKDVVPQLISYGRMLRPVIGVELASDQWLQRYQVEGVPVVQVYPGLPAAEAGISGAYRNARGEIVLGDIITHIDGKPIQSQDDYFSALEARKPGEIISIKTRLGDESRNYQVELVESQ